MSNTTINISLNDKQEAKYQEWSRAIKIIYGEFGKFEWTISSNGLGYNISVYSVLANRILDLTDIDEW